MGTTVAGVAGMAGSRSGRLVARGVRGTVSRPGRLVARRVRGTVSRGIRRIVFRSGGLVVSWLTNDWDIQRSRSVGEGLASGEVLGGLREDSVRGAQVRKLVLRGGGLGLVALDVDVEVGEGIRVEFAVDTDNLVVEVLLEVSLDVVGRERLKLAGSLLALKTGGQGNRAFGHDGLRRVGATDHHTTDNTI